MILARHAESLFWAGRYLERAEVTSRWLDVAGRMTMHLSTEDSEEECRQMTRALRIDSEFDASGRRHDQREVCGFLFDGESGSVQRSLELMRDNLRVARDRMPVELWEEVNRLHLRLDSLDIDRLRVESPHEIFTSVREGCQAISGVMSESMMRDEGYGFIASGRMLERAILTASMLESSLAGRRVDPDRILRSCSALQAFRRSHGHERDPIAVVTFLLEAPDVPRSVRFCLSRIESRLNAMGGSEAAVIAQRAVGRLRSRLEFGEISSALTTDPRATLDELEQQLLELGGSISSALFRPMGEPVLHAQFVRPGLEENGGLR